MTGPSGFLNLAAQNLQITGTLNESGTGIQQGGDITLVSRSVTPLVIGLAGTNFVNGSVLSNSGPGYTPSGGGSGGSITIQNTIGGVQAAQRRMSVRCQ